MKTGFLKVLLFVPILNGTAFGNSQAQIGGYGELHYNKPTRGFANSSSAGRLDFHRFVIYVGYHFNPRISFNSEIEIEHTLVRNNEDSGELSIEQAFLNFQFHKSIGFQAGIILVPLGLVNIYHEPPTFHGVERPNVERYIVPSTWREAGIGLTGKLKKYMPFAVFIMAGLDPDGLDGKNGIRGARQKGFESSTQDVAFATRLDYQINLYLNIGGAFYFSTMEKSAEYGSALQGVNFAMGQIHAQCKFRDLHVRFLLAYSGISNTEKLNEFYSDSTRASLIGDNQLGGYGEIAYDLFGFMKLLTEQRFFAFLRYELYDTHHRTSGINKNPAFERKETSLGFTYLPVPNVCLKADYQFFRTGDGERKEQFNLGIGYRF
jgi:hypothetical protein